MRSPPLISYADRRMITEFRNSNISAPHFSIFVRRGSIWVKRSTTSPDCGKFSLSVLLVMPSANYARFRPKYQGTVATQTSYGNFVKTRKSRLSAEHGEDQLMLRMTQIKSYRAVCAFKDSVCVANDVVPVGNECHHNESEESGEESELED
ncbi:hypothetical protein PRIPAC_72713 [Pristionchus pacificus]|uniref:Uncharacterized protein n=1 Tax=Pristionchus pacificus TaxID=54126 RepID=A0A2A6C8J9_PRIPA|nr:hypothetical protein PRIPAC_72713 [Pristionchus pacificus]|eukprot:PDM74426.1 hypothetical protein PRIPAC_41782 [Pristionchus pacificus]